MPHRSLSGHMRTSCIQPADAFTLQLVSFSTADRADEYLRAQPEPADFARFRLQRDGRILHVVVYGRFDSRAAAAEASANPAGARALFNEMRFEVMAGQYLDVLDEVEVPGHDPAAALERARTVLRFKSARYSVVHPLGLGGVLAGADEHVLEHYERLSSPLGEAFQLQDDLLGVFGDPAVTGKPAGDDLREGKRTALVAHALDLLTGDQVDRLEAALGDPDLGPEAVAQIQRLLESSGARARVERDVAELGEASLAALAQAPMHEDARSGLDRLARRILGQGR